MFSCRSMFDYTQAAQALFMNHTSNTIWRRIIRVYMGFSMKVVKSENVQ